MIAAGEEVAQAESSIQEETVRLALMTQNRGNVSSGFECYSQNTLTSHNE